MLKLFRRMPFTIEVKYDGLRAQIHRLSDGTYKIFSTPLCPVELIQLRSGMHNMVSCHELT